MKDTSAKKTRLYELIEGIEIAMFTTRRPDGRLVSRPMATQARAAGADLWFVTDASAYKLDELEQDRRSTSRTTTRNLANTSRSAARRASRTIERRSQNCIARIGKRGSAATPRKPERRTIRALR